MKLLGQVVLIGSLMLLAMGVWGRVHVIISAGMIMKAMGVIGIIAGISLLFTDKKRY